MSIFVLTYDRGARELIGVQTFGSSERDRATAVRLEMELSAYAADADLEVVTLEADSLDDLRRTHRAYFEDVAAELVAG